MAILRDIVVQARQDYTITAADYINLLGMFVNMFFVFIAPILGFWWAKESTTELAFGLSALLFVLHPAILVAHYGAYLGRQYSRKDKTSKTWSIFDPDKVVKLRGDFYVTRPEAIAVVIAGVVVGAYIYFAAVTAIPSILNLPR